MGCFIFLKWHTEGETPDKIRKIAEKFDKSKKEVKDAIHKIKAKKGIERNTDIEVDLNTGEVYPKGPDGRLGDSIGNIIDMINGIF